MSWENTVAGWNDRDKAHWENEAIAWLKERRIEPWKVEEESDGRATLPYMAYLFSQGLEEQMKELLKSPFTHEEAKYAQLAAFGEREAERREEMQLRAVERRRARLALIASQTDDRHKRAVDLGKSIAVKVAGSTRAVPDINTDLAKALMISNLKTYYRELGLSDEFIMKDNLERLIDNRNSERVLETVHNDYRESARLMLSAIDGFEARAEEIKRGAGGGAAAGAGSGGGGGLGGGARKKKHSRRHRNKSKSKSKSRKSRKTRSRR